jgi:DNA-binding transcriptional regulator YiaG
MAKKLDLNNISKHRKSTGLNQSDFWSRFGVTQSGGSRYESGRNLPKPVAMLVWLRESGKLSDQELEAAKKAISKR